MIEHLRLTLLRRADQEVSAIGLVGHLHAVCQVGFANRLDDPAFADQPHQQPNRAGAAAEAEAVDWIADVAIAADESVELLHVLPDANAERAAKRGNRLEVFGADAV